MKLLHRTILSYLLYSVAVMCLVAPVFYFLINRIFIKEVDETLFNQKKEILKRTINASSIAELKIWEDLDGDVLIEPTNWAPHTDSIYYSKQLNSFTQEQEPYRVLSSVIEIKGKLYHLVARISLVESEDLIQTVGIAMMVVLLFLLAGLLVINWQLSKRIWRPFYQTLDALQKFEVEKAKPIEIGHANIKEFEDLNQAILQLTQRDHQAYLSQKEFTENAAHEMQTPLAVFQARLEMLMQTEPTEEQAGLMQSMMEATTRLSKLNKALLLLSKIESQQFIEMESVNVNDLTATLIQLFEREAFSKGISLSVQTSEPLVTNFNLTLLDILLSNLISNAIRHNEGNNEVAIVIGRNSWLIKNRGLSLTADPDKIFDRFQKNNPNTAGTGLGLAIAKKICEAGNCSIAYEYKDHSHNFLITFLKS